MRFGNRSALENWVAQMKPRREYAKALQPRRFKGLISMDLIRYVVRSSSGVRNRILSAPVVDRLNAVSIRAALSLALAVCLIPKGTAQAELFGPQYRSWEGYDNAPPPDRSWGMGDYEPFSQKRQRAHTKHELRPKAAPQRQHALHREESKSKTKTQNVAKEEPKPKSEEVAKGPLQIIISIADQRISVYDYGTLIARSSVSTGVPGHPTPIGVFSVIGKELWHRSNIYSAAPMPYMQRITWSGIALHAGALPGYPASHGCIRLANDFAIRLWHLTKRGTRVIIARHDVHPQAACARSVATGAILGPSTRKIDIGGQRSSTAASASEAAVICYAPRRSKAAGSDVSVEAPGDMPVRLVGDLTDRLYCVTYRGRAHGYAIAVETLDALSWIREQTYLAFDAATDPEFYRCPSC